MDEIERRVVAQELTLIEVAAHIDHQHMVEAIRAIRSGFVIGITEEECMIRVAAIDMLKDATLRARGDGHVLREPRSPINRPNPSLAILAAVAVALALILFGRQYLSPRHSADAMGQAAVAGYSRAPSVEAPDEEDAATIGGMMDAGRLWAKQHKPNSAAGC